jgi:NADH-ubiquinone oxidoreductase chain 4
VFTSLSLENKSRLRKITWILGSFLVLAFSIRSLFIFYILFELRLVPILLIILSAGNQPERLSSGAYLLFYTTIISIPYLSIVLLIDSSLVKIGDPIIVLISGVIRVIVLTPFLVKMPIFGLHF